MKRSILLLPVLMLIALSVSGCTTQENNECPECNCQETCNPISEVLTAQVEECLINNANLKLEAGRCSTKLANMETRLNSMLSWTSDDPYFTSIALMNLAEGGYINGDCVKCSRELERRLDKAGYDAYYKEVAVDCNMDYFRDSCGRWERHAIVCIGRYNDVCIECLSGSEIPPITIRQFTFVG
jgi:hypothetical protein